MGGLPGMGGGKKSRGKAAAKPKGRKGKSGNPAKRAEQERAAVEKAAATRGASFGGGALDGSDGEVDPASVELPPGFEKFLGR
jgi:signal recognition particle subunit SRP54